MSIIIAAAILANDSEQFEQVLAKYIEAGLKHIDIDIQAEPFASSSTLSLADAAAVFESVVGKSGQGKDIRWTWDLKLSDADIDFKLLGGLASKFDQNFRVVIYEHDEAVLAKLPAGLIAIYGVRAAPKAPRLNHLASYAGVQFMTIAEERQGAEFSEKLFERAVDLRFQDYEGEIGIDGGVNLKSARQIAEVQKVFPIDRVSVGSYFQSALAEEIQLKLSKLTVALSL